VTEPAGVGAYGDRRSCEMGLNEAALGGMWEGGTKDMRFQHSSGAGRHLRFGVSLLGMLVAALVSGTGCTRITTPTQTTSLEQGGITGAVARWLDEYRGAWNAGDSAKLGRMMGLNEAEVWSLQRVLEERTNLRVAIEDVRIAVVDGSLARATYVRRDRWIDRATGQPRSSSAAYEQTFRLADGAVREISLRRR
jgi:hypothetical protein